MADETTTVADDDIQDVSLIDTPLDAPIEAPSETAEDTPADEGSDTQEQQETAPSEGEDTPPKEAEQPQPTEQQLAEQAKERARMEYQQRQRTKQAVAQQLDQAYGPKSEEDLVQEGYDQRDAQVEALRQEMQYERQKTYIAELNAGMQAEAVQVTSDFPVFNPNSPDFDPEFTGMVEQQYKLASRLQTDEAGIVVNAEVPLYDFYKQMHNIYSRGTSRGQQQGQQEYQQMLSRTENPGGSSSTSKGDSLEELEERLGDVAIT